MDFKVYVSKILEIRIELVGFVTMNIVKAESETMTFQRRNTASPPWKWRASTS